MLQHIDRILCAERLRIRICKLHHGIGRGLSEVTMEHPADSQSFFEVSACFIMSVQLLAGVCKHDELAHDLLIVHGAADTFEPRFETLLVQIESGFVVVLLTGDDSEIQVYFGDD